MGVVVPRHARSFQLRASPALAAVFGFVAFLPYPAIAAGEHSGIQMGHIVTMLILGMTLMVSWKHKPYFLFPLLLVPACLSLVKTAIAGDGSLPLGFKALVSAAVSVSALTATQFLAPRHAISLMKGIAWATLLHVAVGIWQMYDFPRGQFPLLSVYVNPAFLSVQDNVTTIIKYIQRPFGLFPEPSAMSSSLAPWAVFWIAELFGLVRLRQQPTRGQRVLFTTAAAGALSLIILSRSGHAMITLGAVVLLALLWLGRSRATVRSYLAVVGVFGVVLPVLIWVLIQSLSTRLNGPTEVDQSWQSRAGSLVIGFSLFANGGPATLIFGLGLGQLGPRMAATSEFDAAWSVLLPYLYQTGIIGLLLVLWIGRYLMHVWQRSGRSMVFALVMVVWLVGITFTTSYVPLLPLWMALGWLTVWPSLCLPAHHARPASLEFT